MLPSAPVVLDELLARRLIVLSGKGGTGKSVVGAALALAARARGRRVLLVEVESPLEVSRFLGREPVGPHETEIEPGLSAVNLDSAMVMEEYIKVAVKVDFFVRRILDSVVYQRFLAFAPGLPELMLLGKIMVLEQAREGWSKRPRYDHVIVDAPATGHGLAFLKVPLAASIAVPVGPVGANARKILALLRDPRKTAVAVVAIPEEMAVVEAIEFQKLLSSELGVRPRALVLNACHERRFSPEEEGEALRLSAEGALGRLAPGVTLPGALAAARRHVRRRKLTAFYQRKIRKESSLPLVSLPYLSQEIDRSALALLAERLETA